MGFPGGSDGKESTCNSGDLGSISGLGRFPEEGMAAYSSILAWRVTRTDEPQSLLSMEEEGAGSKESDMTEAT